MRIIRYLCAGAIGTITNLGTFSLLIFTTKIWYVFATMISFSLSITISFLLQKFWTFRNRATENVHKQALFFLGLSLINLGINTTLVFLFVEKVHVPKIVAAFVAAGLVAIESYFMYKKVIFKSTSSSPQQETAGL